MITRRVAAIGGLAVGLSGVMPRLGRAALADLAAAAGKEGEVTWYVSHYGVEPATEIAAAFSRIYPSVKVNLFRSTAQVVYQRLQQDIKAGTPLCDVLSTTDIGQYATLKSQGRLASFNPQNAADIAPAFKPTIDPDGCWHPTSGILTAIGYNAAKLPAAEAPKRWRDLTDPRWRSKVALGHPAFSGVAGVWALMIERLYGWKFFEEIEPNKPLIGRSMNDMVTMLNSGERSVAASLSGLTLESAAKGNPLGVIFPEEGTLLVQSPSAVLASSKHPNAARLFLEFMLSAEYAKMIVVSPRYESVRSDVPPLPGGTALDAIKIVSVPDNEVVAGIAGVIERWRDTFGN